MSLASRPSGRRAPRRVPGRPGPARRVLLALVLLLAARVQPAAAGELVVRPALTLAGAGAANPWLLPGPVETDAWLMVLPSVEAAWWTRRAGLSLEYGYMLQHYLEASLTGQVHEGTVSGWWRPAPAWRLEIGGGGGATFYDTPGPALVEGTLPLLATRSTNWTAAADLLWVSGPVELWLGYVLLDRRSTGDLGPATEATEAVDETFHEATVSFYWRPAPRVRLGVLPLVQVRAASIEALSYRGVGGRLSTEARLWPGATAAVYVRAQANWFEDRADVYARVGVEVQQQVGAWLRLGLRHAYTANGSPDPLWDADRHVLLATAEIRPPALGGD